MATVELSPEFPSTVDSPFAIPDALRWFLTWLAIVPFTLLLIVVLTFFMIPCGVVTMLRSCC